MRIRRRPLLSFPPFPSSHHTPSLLSDPTPQHLNALSSASGHQKLHPAQDPQFELVQHQHSSSDSLTLNSTTNQVQVVKSEVKEEDEERTLDSNRRSESAHELEVNSKKRFSSNSVSLGATASRLGETALPPRRTGKNAVAKAMPKANNGAVITSLNCSSFSGSSEMSENENSDTSKTLAKRIDAPSDGNSNINKKRRAPAVLKEGSRCSRVNGRGWRCCQQTLVGYSLCEHHLGKGRLRSMSSVRGQLGTSKTNADTALLTAKSPSPSGSSSGPATLQRMRYLGDSAENEAADGFEGGGVMKRKRKKSATVRSVTSLLSERRGSETTELAQPEDVALVLLGSRMRAMV